MLKKIIPYLSLFLFLLLNPLLNLLTPDDLDTTKYKALELENASLKEEVEELSHIYYTNYNYKIAKIQLKNLYNSNTYLLKSDEPITPKHPVINSHGLIGITNTDKTLLTLDNLTISIRVGESKGVFQNNKVLLNTRDIPKINTSIYTSGLTNFPPNIYVGSIKACDSSNSTITCEVETTLIDTTYVLILEDYTI